MLSFPHFFFTGFSLSLGAASAQTLSELSLPAAATKALAAHPSIAANRAQTQSAKEKVAEAHAARWFRVDYSESFSRSDNPVFVFGGLLTQRQFSESNFAIGALNRPNFLNNSQSLVSIDQPIWDAGRARYAEAAADANAKASVAVTRQSELWLVARTARSYMDVNLATEALQVATQALKSGQADRDRAISLRDAGRATDADVLSVEVHLAHMHEQIIARRTERNLALAALNESMGAPLDSEHLLTTPLAAAPVVLPASVNRPEAEVLRLQTSAAESQWSSARSALFPQISARGVFEADRQRIVTRAGINWFAGVTLRWTPFDGGATRANIRSASAHVDALRASERNTASQVALEVKQSQEMLTAAQARLAATATMVAMAEESLRITQNRYGAGLATITDLLRTETASHEAKLRRLMAVHALRLAQFQIFASAGQLTANSEVLQ